MTESKVRYLVQKFFRNQCTDTEKAELADWIERSATDAALKSILADAWKDFQPTASMPVNKADAILSAILNTKEELATTNVPVQQLWWKKLSVAAALILLLGSAGYLLMFNENKQKIGRIQNLPVNSAKDAGSNKAVLTLSDGSRLFLDTGFAGTLARQGNTDVISSKGELSYKTEMKTASATMLYNTLVTNKGQLYPLNLSDGSKVWLNSSSSIKFPVAFTGKERLVEVNGEAYFEVANNPDQPFKVLLNGMQVEVLGTHFNVNGYSDESVIKTTLLEGALKVSKGDISLLLLPGQQAGLQENGNIDLIKNIDMEEAVSWKDGYFHFKEASLETVMRQLARWYDVEVVFENKEAHQTFSGDLEKNLSISRVVEMLEMSQVRCKLEGKKLVVLR